MSEDAAVDVQIDGIEAVRHASDAPALVDGLKRLFGEMALTTEIDRRDQTVAVGGENWRLEATEDGLLRFKPGGASLRLVRRAEDLTDVRQEPERVTFVFDDGEAIGLSRGVEQQR